MSLPTLPTDYARWASLRQLVGLVIDRYNDATDHFVAIHYDGDPERFSAALAAGDLGPLGPSAENLRELIELIIATSGSDYTLGYEDRDFLGRVRSSLCDALVACLQGDFDGLATHTDQAYRGLRLITYERKRTDKRNYHNPFANEKPRFERLTARTLRLSLALARAAVSA